MGEAKRRKQLDPNFGLTPRNLPTLVAPSYYTKDYSLEDEDMGLPRPGEGVDCFLNKDALRIAIQLVSETGHSLDEAIEIVVDQFGNKVFNQRYFQLCEKSQGLFELWFDMVNFAQIASAVTNVQFTIKWWENYWEKAVSVLGRANISDPQLFNWLRRVKGVTMYVMGELGKSFSPSSMLEFSSVMVPGKQPLSMGETTIEVGLAFAANNIIYFGKSLTVYKGTDTFMGRGELMIAVKHASGCWNHYPSPENMCIPLSDYKKAKLALKKFPISLKGELIHSQSNKLAKLLGLTVRENYAYLIKW
jgi:hypothetical protein